MLLAQCCSTVYEWHRTVWLFDYY